MDHSIQAGHTVKHQLLKGSILRDVTSPWVDVVMREIQSFGLGTPSRTTFDEPTYHIAPEWLTAGHLGQGPYQDSRAYQFAGSGRQSFFSCILRVSETFVRSCIPDGVPARRPEL